jgi:hypothetical protein
LNISTISTILEKIQSNIKFKASDDKFNQITGLDNDIIKKFIEKSGSFDRIIEERKKKPSEIIYGNSSDNYRLLDIYGKLIEEIKFKPKANLGGTIYKQVNGKKIFFTYLNYPNLSYQIVNLYLTSMMGKLVSLNFCFNFFNLFISDYESTTSYFYTVASTNLINPDYIMGFINKIINNNYFTSIVTSIDSANNYYSNELKIIGEIKKEEKKKFGKITIQLQTDNLFKIASPNQTNLLKFYLVIDYGFVEQTKTFSRCVSEDKVSLIKYDKSILEGEYPSNFKMTFSILDEKSNEIKNKIELNLNYYNCKFEKSTLYNNVHSRYEFVMYINNEPFYLNPYDTTNKLNKFIV